MRSVISKQSSKPYTIQIQGSTADLFFLNIHGKNKTAPSSRRIKHYCDGKYGPGSIIIDSKDSINGRISIAVNPLSITDNKLRHKDGKTYELGIVLEDVARFIVNNL